MSADGSINQSNELPMSTRRFKESWGPIARNSASWRKSRAAPYSLDWHETSPKEKTCTPWCSTGSSTRWPKPPEGPIADTQLKKGSLKKPLTTSRGQESQRSESTRSDPSKRPRPDTKKTGERSFSTYHAKTGYAAPPNGSNAWTEGGSRVIWRTTPWGISPSFPTYTPQGCITTTTTKTPPGHYPCGSLPLSVVAEPLKTHYAASSTSSPSTIGVLWLRSTATGPWTSNAKRSAARSTSLTRSFKRLASKGGLARAGWKRPRLTAKSATCSWGKRGPERNKSI